MSEVKVLQERYEGTLAQVNNSRGILGRNTLASRVFQCSHQIRWQGSSHSGDRSRGAFVCRSLCFFCIFKASLVELDGVVTELASVCRAIVKPAPANPDAPDFRLGKTLGSANTNWQHIKQGMPDRHSLFFRFESNSPIVTVYVWFNGENTLRKAGSKTDVYGAFKRVPARGVVLNEIAEWLADAAQVNT